MDQDTGRNTRRTSAAGKGEPLTRDELKKAKMHELFFDQPGPNSPYEYPGQHWNLDPSGDREIDEVTE